MLSLFVDVCVVAAVRVPKWLLNPREAPSKGQHITVSRKKVSCDRRPGRMHRVSAVRICIRSVATRERDGGYADVTFHGVMEYYANADNPVLILIFIRAYVIVM